ncbi:elongation factor EF-2 [Candidatus Woesearchaeota archaeon]|nr:elongation factor EF-2 [Candidatus Woesearchaeota archaeon]
MGEKMVDKVVRISRVHENIRNIAICAHIDHGKTTFSDNLLAGSGMMAEELAGKARQLDFQEDEIARGITIDAASVSMVHEFDGKEFLINLIDTPGHVDFGGDVTRAMRAVDGCIVLVDAVEGIMPQTETVLRQALKERVKPTLFINKVDRLIKELQLTPDKMQERFVSIIMSVNQLIKKIAEKEYGEKWHVNVQDGSVSFGSAFHNWALSIPFMKKKGVTLKDVIDAYQGANEQYKTLAKKAPIHECVLNMVIAHLPNPKTAQAYRIPKIWRGEIESVQGKALTACDPAGPINFCITKIVVDPQAGEISAGRLFSGTMARGTEVFLLGAKQKTRIQQVFIYNGAKREIVDQVPSGNIIGIAGVKSYPGETVSSVEGEPFEQITHLFAPVVTKSIEAKKPSDLPRVIEVLRQVSKEDPSIKIEINEETGEHLISGMGELHLEIIENRIKNNKGVEIVTSNPIVVYRESVMKKAAQEFEGKSPNKHNKLYFIAEPMLPALAEAIKRGEIPEGRMKKKDLKLRDKLMECGMDIKVADKVKDIFNGNIFVDQTRGIVYIQEIIELVLDMFEDVMKSGPLAREPCFNVMISLVDCKLHEDSIHRGPAQMYPAVREGIRGTMMDARPVLFEPVQTILFETLEEYMGEISKLIANKRGQLLDMVQDGGMIQVKGKVPVAEMFGMSNDLRSATGGRGSSSMIDQTFEKLPDELQSKIIVQIRSRKGLSENQ